MLEGLHLEDIKRTGEHLILQDGCRGFFQKTLERENFKTDVHILSYCWCGDLIRSTFSSGMFLDVYMFFFYLILGVVCLDTSYENKI